MTSINKVARVLTSTLIALLILQAILAAGSRDAQAAVSLLYFRGQHNGNSVLLQWATATELDTAYFYLERSAEESGPYQMLSQIGFVPSEAPPDGLSGAQYERRDDDNLITNRAYWYVLVEVEIGLGNENRTEPIRVATGDSQPTHTVTPVATGTQAPSPTPSQSAVNVTLTATSVATSALAAATVETTALPGVSQTPSESVRVTADDPQALPLANAAATTAASDLPGALELQAQATSAASAYPALDVGAPAGSPGSAGYPAAPPTPEVFVTSSYPASSGPNNAVNGTPIPNIGSRSEGQANQATGDTAIANNSPLLGTLFLWLGFAAAFVVFVSAVVGAIYFYSRQRTGSN